MLLGHPNQAAAVIRADDEDGVGGTVAGETKHCRPKVLFVAGEIKEGDHLGCTRKYILPNLLLAGKIDGGCGDEMMSVDVKGGHFLANAAGSTGFDFVRMAEDARTGFAATIVPQTASEDA